MGLAETYLNEWLIFMVNEVNIAYMDPMGFVIKLWQKRRPRCTWSRGHLKLLFGDYWVGVSLHMGTQWNIHPLKLSKTNMTG